MDVVESQRAKVAVVALVEVGSVNIDDLGLARFSRPLTRCAEVKPAYDVAMGSELEKMTVRGG